MYPKLVRKACTPAHITLYAAEPNEFNEREVILEGDFLVNMQAGGGVVFTAEKQRIQLSGVLLCDGDICPACDSLAVGKAEISGARYDILRVQKCRNPDGSVNYTRIEVV